MQSCEYAVCNLYAALCDITTSKLFQFWDCVCITLSYLHTRSCVRAVCGGRSAAGVWPACSQLGVDCFYMIEFEVNIVKVTKVEITMVEVTMAGVWPESKRSAVRGFFRDMLSWAQSFFIQCTMVPLSTKSCLKSSKLRPILNGQFCHAISRNICTNVFGSKQPWEILVFVIFKL